MKTTKTEAIRMIAAEDGFHHSNAMRCRNQANGREHDLQCPQKVSRGEAFGLAVTRRLELLP